MPALAHVDAGEPRPVLRRKPDPAEISRANGRRSRGPVTAEGRQRACMNPLTHGLRARRFVAVAALGERAEDQEALLAAVRLELAAVGPVARHLAETIGCAMLRGARAERLEGELLAGIGEGSGPVARALHADRDARASLALVERYRRNADGDLRRALDTLLRLRAAADEGRLAPAEVAADAQGGLDSCLADSPRPNEPGIEKIVTEQPVTEETAPPRKPEPTAEDRLETWRSLQKAHPADGRFYWSQLTPAQRAAVLQAAQQQRQAKAEGRDTETLYRNAAAEMLR
ncbi:MAG: hypothetical protein U1E14_19170 [Geminicoccaceae bacterium]